MRATRLLDAPIIAPALHPSIGTNIQGPSLIRAPAWLPAPLGRYYLYFADHKGAFIRLAYADALLGPWRIHPPGTLHLAQSGFPARPLHATPAQLAHHQARNPHLSAQETLAEITTPHIASPDVHVDHANRRIMMYYHGLDAVGTQLTRLATSPDGLRFTARPEPLGPSYMRIFHHAGTPHALAMPGTLLRAETALGPFHPGPTLFNPHMRHAAVLTRDDTLHVLWTQVGHAPERILHTRIPLQGDWHAWRTSPAADLLRPERPWEGALEPLAPSTRGTAPGPVHQLRDPALFEDDGDHYLLYAVAGESGIAIARLAGLRTAD